MSGSLEIEPWGIIVRPHLGQGDLQRLAKEIRMEYDGVGFQSDVIALEM